MSSAESADARLENLRNQGKAPRMDLDVPHELCGETIQELTRRRWKISEIADYCDAPKRTTARTIRNSQYQVYPEPGAPKRHSAGALLWYRHPSELNDLIA